MARGRLAEPSCEIGSRAKPPTDLPAVMVKRPAAPEIDATAPEIDATAPEISRTVPQINVTAPEINLTAPEIDQTVPEIDQTAPEIDQTVPEIDQTAPEIDIPQRRSTELRQRSPCSTGDVRSVQPIVWRLQKLDKSYRASRSRFLASFWHE